MDCIKEIPRKKIMNTEIKSIEIICKLLEKCGFRDVSISEHDINRDFSVKSLPSMYVNAKK